MINKEVQIKEKIKEILWKEWDPIGVNQFSEAGDEYDMYIPSIYDILVSFHKKQDISNYLMRIERERMGLEPDVRHDNLVAQKIWSLI